MAGAGQQSETSLHASCVTFGRCGVLITGPSGSGKSGLALQLIALGARLVADDLTRLILVDGHLVAQAPPRLAGVIEARGVGLLQADYQASAPVRLLVDMGREETRRLPHIHVTELLGVGCETIYKSGAPHFAAAIKVLSTGGRYA